MYKIRENDIFLSPTIHFLTWHPFIFALISGRLPMLNTSRPNYTCMHTHIFTVWQISLFRSCDITLRRNIISIQPVLHLVLPEIYKKCTIQFLSRTTNGVGLHLVVCPHLCIRAECDCMLGGSLAVMTVTITANRTLSNLTQFTK